MPVIPALKPWLGSLQEVVCPLLLLLLLLL
jgi:hypothetical protein